MKYYITIRDYSNKKTLKMIFNNKHELKEHLRTYTNAYVEIEYNYIFQSFNITRFSKEIWLEA